MRDPLAAKFLEPTWPNLMYPPEGYRYFDNDLRDPSNPPPELRAAWAVDAAILAYGKARQVAVDGFLDDQQITAFLNSGGFDRVVRNRTWLQNGPDVVENLKSWGAWVFFASNDNWAIVSFRGTADPRNLTTDLNAGRAPATKLDPDFSKAMVHKGIQENLDANGVWEQVSGWLNDYRDKHPDAEICFTGHSLGAAWAAMAAARFRRGNLSLYTFGCPRTGDETFCQAVAASVPGKWFRYMDGNDLVTRVPLLGMGYAEGGELRHVGTNDPPSLQLAQHEDLIRALGDLAKEAIANGARDLVHLRLADALRSLEHREIPHELYDLADHSPSRYLEYVWRQVR